MVFFHWLSHLEGMFPPLSKVAGSIVNGKDKLSRVSKAGVDFQKAAMVREDTRPC